MSTSSLSSYSSYGALSTAKKTPKRFVKEPSEPNKAEVIKAQLDVVKLELDTFKMNMDTTDTTKCKDNWMDQIDCKKLVETIDSLATGLSAKLDVIRQLAVVPKDKPSLVINDAALVKANERLDETICILENLRELKN
ncbi:uncharacterized protein LOC128385709 [Panonychus citri]|uniref:uncharacterized protein LOC128385709 n=1 Tax=Panonychus citri TaxID=50023 RepID=UPI002307F945|nr:uncharacterized protein LOC128385709 [Panonychus citri]